MEAHPQTTNVVAERQSLLLSAGGNLGLACAGIGVAAVSSSQAILLDGLFNLTYMISGLFTLKIARLVQRGDDERFPVGYAYFEPLINGIKGVLVLGVSLMALGGAVQALLAGGREISAGLAVVYGIIATVVCWVMAVLTRRGCRRTGSPLVRTDAANWIVNAAISSCVLAAFVAMFLIRDTRLSWMLPWIDPALVLVVVLITIGVPIRMGWSALMELLNRAPPADVVDRVRSVVATGLAELPIEAVTVRVVQPGRTRAVFAHVVLPADRFGALGPLDEVRAKILEQLKREHDATTFDALFTVDREWGAPLDAGDPT